MASKTKEPEAETPVEEKRLTRDERRALEKIVKNDFQNLREEIAEQAQRSIAQQYEQVDREYDSLLNGVVVVNAELRELVNEFRARLDQFIAEKLTQGYTALNRYSSRDKLECHITEFEVAGLDDAKSKVSERVTRARQAAQRNLNRIENDTMRDVLLTGIASSKAQEILDGLPDASSVLAAALETVDTPAILGAPR